MPRLLVIKGADEGKQFDLTDAIASIGRDASNTIRLHDTEVSRRHAEVRRVTDGHALADVGSANGTFVNNQRIQVADLRAGDHVAIGQTILVYSTGRDNDATHVGELAEQINVITRADVDFSSAIIKTIGETEGSRILLQPEKGSPWLRGALANLRIMYEASQAISHILDIDQLLKRILELIFRSIPADRGCVLLRATDAKGEPEPKALHWRKPEDHEEKFPLSRTIVEHTLQKRVGVLVSDAPHDERFQSGQSILQLGIREVICVPMKGRHDSIGVLYLDSKTSTQQAVAAGSLSRFTEDHLALAIAIAHQAALAVEETRYHQAMVQAERLAAMGQTIAALSHHIKNILQGLRSGNDILRMGIKDKNDNLIQQGHRISEKNQAKIYDLVMDMLSYSKERVPTVEPTNLNEVVKDVHDLLAPRAKERNVMLVMQLADTLPEVQADSEGIHRALLNIVGNAIDAVEDRPEPKVTIATRLGEEDTVRIVVLDNGPGIAPEQVAEIFKPFISTKGSRGTGLGLPVSRKILREHGGDIVVQSQVNVGSKFVLKVPIKSLFGLDPNATSADLRVAPTPPEPD